MITNTGENNFGDLKIIALSSASKPCIMALSGTNTRGRIVIDCAWTKLFKRYWDNEGIAKYV